MLYFNLTMTALPQIKSACSASTDQYRLHMKGTQKNLEITTLEGCSVDMTVDGKTYVVPPKSVIVVMPGMECDLVSHEPGTVYDDTITVCIDGLQYETLQTGAARRADAEGEDSVLLPMILTPGDEYANFSRLVRTFISYYVRNSAFARCRCLSLWFELLASLNLACRNQLNGCMGETHLPSAQVYVRKAKTYIDQNYHKNLHIPDVAEELRITPNYLSSMFKQITGKTVLDYIHITRIEAVKDLLIQPHSESLADIAAKTGLGNTRSLCALFKRITGVSVKEYLRISKELTRYHEVSWNVTAGELLSTDEE